jgi:hypothetical protein
MQDLHKVMGIAVRGALKGEGVEKSTKAEEKQKDKEKKGGDQ